MNTNACRCAASAVVDRNAHHRSRGLPPNAAARWSEDRFAAFLGEEATFETRMDAPGARRAIKAVFRLRPKTSDATPVTD